MTANYYLMITELSKIQLTQDDYGDKKKVKLSNRAAKTLQGIEKEMRKDPEPRQNPRRMHRHSGSPARP